MNPGADPAAVRDGAGEAIGRALAGLPGGLRVTLGTFIVYALATGGVATGWNAHTQLAWSLLHGSFALHGAWGTSEVVKGAQGQAYLVYGPGPSLLLMPLVALFGRGLDQTLASAFFGSVAVGFWWAFLGRFGTTESSRRWLTVLFAFGTPYFYAAAENGNNWSITTCTAVMFLVAALSAVAHDRPLLAGLAAGMAPLCRYPTLLLAPSIGMLLLAREARSWREVRFDFRRLAIFAVGVGVPLALLCLYNWARFGAVTDEGYRLYAVSDPVAGFGSRPLFGLQYAWHNVPFYLFTPPIFSNRFPWLIPSRSGMSMLLACPAYFLLVFSSWRRPANQLALAGAAAVQAVYWLYYTDGVGQFGMRYAVDYLPMLLLVVATLGPGRPEAWTKRLALLGISVEAWGFLTWHVMGWG